MCQSNIYLLDLPNEILLIFIKKLHKVDVLYSLFGINNGRLDILLQEDVFINTLNVTTASSITGVKFDRFCTQILPQTRYIKKLILEPTPMKRILLLSDYPNLTYL
ncbi:unnamed protein product [Rotaria socialis]